eukprot:49265-Pyramimonas_sp.AAC.1
MPAMARKGRSGDQHAHAGAPSEDSKWTGACGLGQTYRPHKTGKTSVLRGQQADRRLRPGANIPRRAYTRQRQYAARASHPCTVTSHPCTVTSHPCTVTSHP